MAIAWNNGFYVFYHPMEHKNIKALRRAFAHANQFLMEIDQRPVIPKASIAELRRRLDIQLQSEGLDAEQVIDEFVAACDGGIIGSTGSRFFAWVIGGALPSGVAADWMTTVWDQNAAIYATSPASAVVEEVAGKWLKQLLDLPSEASFAFTSGCQMAHFTSLTAARFKILRQLGWDVNEQGLIGAPAIHVITSDQCHGSIDRAVRLLGIGLKHLIKLKTDANGQTRVEDLVNVLNQYNGPMIVVLNAADLNIGACDSFRRLIPIAKSSGAWVHIDGAFGLFARASEKKRHFVDGIELADSWATDAHKWLNVPFDCGIAFVRDSEAHQKSMTLSASYITSQMNARDQIDWNPEWSRRSRGNAVYAVLRELGTAGVEDLVDRTCQYAESLVTQLGGLPNVEVLWKPHLNQGLIRFLDSKPNATDKDHDLRTDQMIQKINDTGEAFFGATTWKGKRAMRVSVVNWRTNERDIQRTVSAISKTLNENS